jgi:hypothetical protein
LHYFASQFLFGRKPALEKNLPKAGHFRSVNSGAKPQVMSCIEARTITE